MIDTGLYDLVLFHSCLYEIYSINFGCTFVKSRDSVSRAFGSFFVFFRIPYFLMLMMVMRLKNVRFHKENTSCKNWKIHKYFIFQSANDNYSTQHFDFFFFFFFFFSEKLRLDISCELSA